MKRYKTLKCNTIYWLIIANTHDIISIPKSHKFWMEKYSIHNVSDYLVLAFTSIRITSIQALQYKIINRIFNCNYWLTKIKILNCPNCRFCNKVETIEHYLYECQKTKEFWNLLKNWWNRFHLLHLTTINERDAVLGLIIDNKFSKTFNCILLIAKGTIYNNKSNNKQPDFYNFLVQLKFFLKIEEQIHIKNEITTQFEEAWGPIFNTI